MESFLFHLDRSEVCGNTSDEIFEELFDLLSQYEVKKMKDNEWDSDVSKVTSFNLTVYTEDEIIRTNIHEDRLSLLGNNQDGQYFILNGPIDLGWIEDFNQKYAPSNLVD